MGESPSTGLLKLLKKEAEHLMSGRLKELEALTPQKTLLEAALMQSPCTESEAQKLKQAADVNARLFKAAINGIKSANMRLSDVAKVRSELSLYTKTGAKNVIGKSAVAMEHKA